MYEFRLRRTLERGKRPKTCRLLNDATTAHRFVALRLPKERAILEQTHYAAISEARHRFEKKDPAITEEILQELCTGYLMVYEEDDNQKTTI